MKKLKSKFDTFSKFYDEKENIIIFFVLLIIICTFSFHFKFYPYDYMWNFGNMYKLYLGYKMYEEVAVIITPMVFYLGEIVFKLFGANYFVFNMLNVILSLSFYLCFFNILKKTTKSPKIRDLILILFVCETGNALGNIGPNYIPLSACFLMLIIISNMYFKDNIWRRVINGFLAALALLSYQKAGAAAALIIFLYEILNKDEIKISRRFKNLCVAALSMIAVVGLYVIYLLITNNLYNFFDLTVLSIGEFSQSNFGVNNTTVIKLAVFGLLTISYFLILLKFKKIDNIAIQLFITVVATMVYMYPIINEYHYLIWFTFLFPFFTYAVNLTVDGVELKSKKIDILVLSIIGVLLITLVPNWIGSIKKYPFIEKKYGDIYFGSTITNEQNAQIQEINEYIDNKRKEYNDVIIFSSYAMLYKDTFIHNRRFFDLPNKGNFGQKGEQGLIEEIQQMDNTLILVQREDSEHEVYQFPNNVRNYIKEHYKNVETLQNFDIYEINNKQKEY